ncbi:MAG: stimulus-sensing domain-containing protein [Caulobacteraceae bacterium]
MASDTATANPDRRPAEAEQGRKSPWWPGSRLGRTIIVLNLLGLAILITGALVLNELRRGLINARIDSLTIQGEVIANVIDRAATVGEPEPALEPSLANDYLQELFIPRNQRVRLFDSQGRVIADSFVVADRVEASDLPPARGPGDAAIPFVDGNDQTEAKGDAAQGRDDVRRELAAALAGNQVSGMRRSESGGRVVSVSIPIRHVRAVLGVLTLEAGDVDQIIAAERRALLPFILIAIGVTLLSSFLLTRLVAEPVLRLARAADRVRLSRSRAIALPDLSGRDDEVGDLAQSLEDMTRTLSERMDAIEAFAADVAHEIKNPLTSIRSAVETLDLVKDEAPRARLMGILKQDVGRLDRLVTDISNASRLDAELARDDPKPVHLGRLLTDIVALYDASRRSGEAHVRLITPESPAQISGREGPLGQVFRNLIDNARSFSPPDGEVRVALSQARGQVTVAVEDDGPGMPPENLETIFQRFYTSRPKGAAFGGNSGLGLSIARQIIEAHGGQITASNREGPEGVILGARFSVTLPEARG